MGQCALYKIPQKTKLQKKESKETMEKNILMAKKSIAEALENNSRMMRCDAMEILEIIQDVQEEVNQPEKESTESSEPTLECSAACDEEIKLDSYIDHVLDCETKIEECWRCGEEFKNSNVHRSLEKHSTPEERFACMTCMRAHATRMRIVKNHKYICIGPGTKKLLVNHKTPEATGEEMQQAYDEDKEIKKLFKEDFRKRNRKHRKTKQSTNPIKSIITVLSTISLIYMILFIIMKSAEKTEIRSTIQNEKIKINMKSENNRKINGYIQNQIKESKNIAEDTMRKKGLENMIKESITAIKDKHRCSEQDAKKAVDNFLKKQEQIMTAEVIRKIKNLKKTEAAIRNRISNDQTAAGIIQNNREILEKKISDPKEAKNPADTSYSKDLVETEMN